MLSLYKNGITSVILRVKILDKTAAYPKGLTGLLFSTAGLIISTLANNEATATAYTQAGSTTETITTLGTFAAPTATKCRFKEVDATNHPGLYEIQIADARFAVANARSIVISLSGAGNMAETDALLQLTNAGLEIDVNAARLGGTVQTGKDVGAAVPAFAPGVSGGLPTLDASLNIDTNTLQKGTATAGGGSTITIAASGASATDNIYNYNIITIYGGTGAGQSRIITGYAQSTKIVTVHAPWTTNPDATSVYKIHGQCIVLTGIRKNVALPNFQVLMTDSSTHVPATGKTISVTRSIDNVSSGAQAAGGFTNIGEVTTGGALGAYKFDFAASDLNGDIIFVRVTATGCDDVWMLIRTNP